MKRDWTTEFDRIDYDSDGRGDALDVALKRAARDDRRMRERKLSADWRRGYRVKRDKAEDVVADLLEIQGVVTKLAAVHGCPEGTSIQIASAGAGNKGAATFAGLPSFTHPMIWLDRAIYDECDTADLLDVYCGVVLHECDHLNDTRDSFLRMHRGELRGERKMWEGLWEDERIENKGRKRSPGFAHYYHALKRALFELKEFGFAMKRWAELPDLDKVNAILFAFIRCPHTLTAEHKTWKTIAGTCVFEELRELFPEVPTRERQVETYGEKIMGFLDKVRAEYGELAGKDEDELEEALKELAKDMFGDDAGDAPSGAGEPCEDGEPGEGGSGGSGEAGDEDSDADGEGGSGATPEDGAGDDPADGGGGTGGDKGDSGDDSGASGDAAGDSDGGEGGTDGGDTGDGAGDAAGDREGDPSGTEGKGTAPTGGSFEPGGAGSDDSGMRDPTPAELDALRKRLDGVRDAAAEDADAKAKMDKAKSKAAAAERELERWAGDTDAVSEAAKGGEESEKELDRTADKVEAARDKCVAVIEDRKGRRFAVIDMERMIERMDTCDTPLDMEESRELAKATRDRLEFAEKWTSPSDRGGLERRTVITHPTPDGESKRRYDAAYNEVQGLVARMKDVFAFRLGERTYRMRERKEGRLDRRALARAKVTKRVFQRTHTRTDEGLSLCLLLDESGSMGGVYEYGGKLDDGYAATALKIAVLIANALKDVPGVELEAYSYGSCGDGERDCLLKYLAGKRQKDIASLGGYQGSCQNYDHIAIQQATRLFKEGTTNPNRLMLVLSDGAPAGTGYGGPSARAAVRDAVRDAERQGVQVIQVAIKNFRSEDMFDNVIRFLDLEDLVNKMRALVTKVVAGVSGG